jgi:hypothetical protein
MKVEHQIVNIIIYMSHMYRNVANFLKFRLNYGYWKSFLRHLILAGLILRFYKTFWLYIWLLKITGAGYPRLPEVDSIRYLLRGRVWGGGCLESRCQKRELTQSRCEDGRTGIPVEVLKHGHLFFLARPLVSRLSLSLSRERALCVLSLCPLTPPTHHIFPILLSHTDLFCLLHRQHISCRPIRLFCFFFVFWVGFDPPTLPPVSYWLVGSVSLSASPAPNPNWIVSRIRKKLARSLLLACPKFL